MSYQDYENVVADILLLEEPPAGSTEPRFTPIRRIGKGSMGTVYQVFDRAIEQIVALKLFDPSLMRSERVADVVRREVQLARRVTDPHVVRLFDLHYATPRCIVSMEYVDGHNLMQVLEESHTATPGETIRLAKDICGGLRAAHESGVIHRDVKPSNILIAFDRCVLADLGLASSLQEIVPIRQRRSGALLYISPEQVDGATLDYGTDIYSFGVVLFEMLTGLRAVSDDRLPSSALANLNAVRTMSPRQYNSSIPDWLSDIVLHCLEIDPARRYQTAAQVLRDLDNQAYCCADDASGSGICDDAERAIGTLPSVSNDSDSEAAPVQCSPSRSRRQVVGWVAIGLAVVSATVVILHRSVFPVDRPTERSIAIVPFDMTAVSMPTAAMLRSLEADLSANIAEALPDAEVWFCDRTSTLNRRSKVLRGAAITIEGRFEEDHNRIMATALIHARGKRTSTIHIEGTSRDYLQFENQLSVALISDQPIRETGGTVRETRGVTSDADAYSAFCQAKSLIRDNASLSELRRASGLLDQAISRDPNFAIGYATKAEQELQAYQMNGDPKLLAEAWTACDNAAHLDPNAPVVRVAMAYAYLVTKQADRAVRLLDDDSLLHSGTVQRFLGLVLLQEGAANEAIKAIQRSLALNPLSTSSYLVLGDCYTQLSDYAKAIEAYRSALDLDENDLTALSNLGEAYIRTDQFSEAIPVLQTLLRRRPDAVAYANLGFAYLYSRQAALAVPLFEKAATLDASTDEYFGALGQVYDLLGDVRSKITLERARSLAFQKAQADPDNGLLLSRLASYDARLGRLASAEREIADAVHKSPTNLDVKYNLALVQVLGHRAIEARETLRALGQAGYDSPFSRDNPDGKLLESLPEFAALRARYARDSNHP